MTIRMNRPSTKRTCCRGLLKLEQYRMALGQPCTRHLTFAVNATFANYAPSFLVIIVGKSFIRSHRLRQLLPHETCLLNHAYLESLWWGGRRRKSLAFVAARHAYFNTGYGWGDVELRTRTGEKMRSQIQPCEDNMANNMAMLTCNETGKKPDP